MIIWVIFLFMFEEKVFFDKTVLKIVFLGSNFKESHEK